MSGIIRPALAVAVVFFAACVGQRQQTPTVVDNTTDAGSTGETADSGETPDAQPAEDQARPAPPPAVAQAIRRLPWRSANCQSDSPLDLALRLDFRAAEGWSCNVEDTTFADLTGDGIEEAIVELEFQHTHVERQPNGETAERRLTSSEFVVIALENDRPELLVQIASEQGDITAADVVDGELSIELQGCWDCGCDIYREVWLWTGSRFAVDEERSVQVYEAPPCSIR